MPTNQSWSIIIFCFNEKGNIESVFKSAIRFLKENNLPTSELIFVDDGSTDGTKELIEGYTDSEITIKKILHPRNLGIGLALTSGYKNSSCENITAIPGDGQFSLDELIPFLNVEKNTFVSFYRQENLQYSLFRNLLSLLNKKINHWFIGLKLKDVNWVKIYKKDGLDKFSTKLKSSLIESEICAKLKLNNQKAIEHISVYHERKHGVSKGASFRVVLKAMIETTKLLFVVNFYRFKRKSK